MLKKLLFILLISILINFNYVLAESINIPIKKPILSEKEIKKKYLKIF